MIMDRAIAKSILLKHRAKLVLANEDPELAAAIAFAVEDMNLKKNLYHEGFLDGCENMLAIFRQGRNAEIVKRGDEE
jgi:hypothetical protein